jgi:hypothetical protein
MSMERWTDRTTQKHLFQCQFIRNTSHKDCPGIEPGLLGEKLVSCRLRYVNKHRNFRTKIKQLIS